jgi:hypothetical protein
MAQDSKKEITRISEEERLHYIGFEVFPGQAGELFKSDAERQKFVDQAKAKRSSGQIIRDQCTLMYERVSKGERLIMAIAAVAMFVALFLPWYSVYNEVPVAGSGPTAGSTDNPGAGKSVAGESANEEIITMAKFQRKTTLNTTVKLGIEGPLVIATVGGALFSSGIALILTSVLLLALTLACIGLPIMSLTAMYRGKGDADQQALHLKKILRYNWAPLVVFAVGLFLSFFGGDYGFNAKETMSSLGSSYGAGAYLGSLSWGFFIALAGSTMLALKGIEI